MRIHSPRQNTGDAQDIRLARIFHHCYNNNSLCEWLVCLKTVSLVGKAFSPISTQYLVLPNGIEESGINPGYPAGLNRHEHWYINYARNILMNKVALKTSESGLQITEIRSIFEFPNYRHCLFAETERPRRASSSSCYDQNIRQLRYKCQADVLLTLLR